MRSRCYSLAIELECNNVFLFYLLQVHLPLSGRLQYVYQQWGRASLTTMRSSRGSRDTKFFLKWNPNRQPPKKYVALTLIVILYLHRYIYIADICYNLNLFHAVTLVNCEGQCQIYRKFLQFQSRTGNIDLL